MIKMLWKKYEQYVLKSHCYNKSGELKYLYTSFLGSLFFLPIYFMVFVLYFNSSEYAIIYMLCFANGRFLNAYIMEINNCDFGEGWIPPYRYIGYSSLMLVAFVVTFALIKLTYENQSITNNLNSSVTKVKTITSKPIDRNVSKFMPHILDSTTISTD